MIEPVFRRAIRLHPLRGSPSTWSALDPVPWHPMGRFTGAADNPADFLDYHTGLAYPQDAASQVPLLLLDPQPGEIIIDACAAPGSKTTQIANALGVDGLVLALDADPQRRKVLGEVLARQGAVCAIVTALAIHQIAERTPGCADAVLVDAPCSGHREVTDRASQRLGVRQGRILDAAQGLVRPGGRLVYSTCTASRFENEDVVVAFLARHRSWEVEAVELPGCDPDLDGLGGVRLGPDRQGTEPFFAIRLRRAHGGRVGSLAGILPPRTALGAGLDQVVGGHVWYQGDHAVVASPQAASCAIPAEVRGLRLGRWNDRGIDWNPWGAQWLVSRGAPAATVSHADACRLWAGNTLAIPDAPFAKTEHGAPLGALAGPALERRLDLPSRMRKSGLR